MLNTSFLPFPELQIQDLRLRQINMADVKEVFYFRSEPRILQHLNVDPCNDLAEAGAFITKLTKSILNGDYIMWGITQNQSKLIGTICLWNLDKQNNRAELGYVLHPDYHRQGIMSQCIKAVVEYGFETMKCHAIEAFVSEKNIPSRHLLEKQGFLQDALMRDKVFFNHQYHNIAVYSIIR